MSAKKKTDQSEARTPDLSNLEGIKWYSPKEPPFRISGFGWFEKEKIYRRLPKKPKYKLREPLEIMANDSTGAQVKFRTDSSRIAVKAEVYEKPVSYHMTSLCRQGFDHYAGETGEMLYAGTSRFETGKVKYESILIGYPEPVMRSSTIFMPLYGGVKKLWIGLDAGAEILPPEPFEDNRKIIFYGTSITQGGCASRPGMAYSNIISRNLNYECVNLGFSGNGKGDPEMARLISEIPDPGLIVLDYEANCSAYKDYSRTLPEFIRIIREKRPDTPILVVSMLRFAADNFKITTARRIKNRNFTKKLVAGLAATGDNNIYFQDGAKLMGRDFHECFVDGVHPTDLGFVQMAKKLTPVIRKIIS